MKVPLVCQLKDRHKIWPGCLPACPARGQGDRPSCGSKT